MLRILKEKFKLYWPLIKSLQTGLLLLTGLAGFMTARCPVYNLYIIGGLLGSLFLAVSGSTILNMVYDRDIDQKMDRTKHRPLASGDISVKEALILGLMVSFAGVAWALSLSFLYGVVVFSGLFIDVVVYTIWLKRKTAWSIVWGGISGGMPILAGRVLGLGSIDFIGALLALSILLWIPTHILTFSIKYSKDYSSAGVPTFPSRYGDRKTRIIIAISSLGAALSIGLGAIALGLSWGYLRILAILTIGIVSLAFTSIFKPSERINFSLFKFASVYMMSSMLILVFGMV
jgi:protoheme IX farnesyltransferase